MQLVINTRGTSLRCRGDRLRLMVKGRDRPIEISAHKVQSIVVATGVQLTSNVIHLATEHNIDIVFLDRSGRPTARVWQTKMGSTARIRRRQLEVAETDESMSVVRDWTARKIANQLDFLRELKQRRPQQAEAFAQPLITLEDCLAKVKGCTGIRCRARRRRRSIARSSNGL